MCNLAEGLARKQAIRARNRGVVTKLIREGEEHINRCNELPRNEWVTNRMRNLCSFLDEKKVILKELDKQTIDIYEITDIKREIKEVDDVLTEMSETSPAPLRHRSVLPYRVRYH